MANPSNGLLPRMHFWSGAAAQHLGSFLIVCSAVLRYSNLLLQVRSGRDFSVWVRYRGGKNGARAICNLDGVQHGAIADFFTGGIVLRLRGSRHTIRLEGPKC
uniref:(northern house mosquito) hypothetical protein n=1 Tax=Culex pipiens TaxID=7175 RepID=A0A8D8D382_CULPI